MSSLILLGLSLLLSLIKEVMFLYGIELIDCNQKL